MLDHAYAVLEPVGSHQAVIRYSSDIHQIVIIMHLIMTDLEIHCTLYYITVNLRYADFGQKPWRYTVF